MMYCEFIERTRFDEDYITESMYHDFIEPAYMAAPAEVNKTTFCECFYNIHNKKVNDVVDGLIIAKSTAEKENYIISLTGFDDVTKKHETLRDIFLEAFPGIYKEYCRKVYDD